MIHFQQHNSSDFLSGSTGEITRLGLLGFERFENRLTPESCNEEPVKSALSLC